MIKKLLLITLLTFGLSNELSTSVSVRTPNDDDKPLDYEYSIKVEDTNDKFQYLLKRDWERELGEKYIDDIAKFSHKVGTFYYGVARGYIYEKSNWYDFEPETMISLQILD